MSTEKTGIRLSQLNPELKDRFQKFDLVEKSFLQNSQVRDILFFYRRFYFFKLKLDLIRNN